VGKFPCNLLIVDLIALVLKVGRALVLLEGGGKRFSLSKFKLHPQDLYRPSI
jgi:hypothetical protein